MEEGGAHGQHSPVALECPALHIQGDVAELLVVQHVLQRVEALGSIGGIREGQYFCAGACAGIAAAAAARLSGRGLSLSFDGFRRHVGKKITSQASS